MVVYNINSFSVIFHPSLDRKVNNVVMMEEVKDMKYLFRESRKFLCL